MITILTPTYNRGYIIYKAYESLIKQINNKFEWLIIDDGSSDNTKEIIDKMIKENKINIKYYYKDNGGKHTAINYGMKYVKGSYTLILDSDDILTDDAIETIYYYINKYQDIKNIGCFSFLRLDKNNKKIGTVMKDKEIISNYIDYRYNNELLGDMAEVFKSNILKEYSFPIYKEEKFLSEAIIWNQIAFNYDTVFINKGIYITDYLEDGLSKNFFKLVYNNPIGAMQNANIFLNKKFKLKIRLKNAILYNGYKLRAIKKYGKEKYDSNNKLLTSLMFIPGCIFYLLLNYKGNK